MERLTTSWGMTSVQAKLSSQPVGQYQQAYQAEQSPRLEPHVQETELEVGPFVASHGMNSAMARMTKQRIAVIRVLSEAGGRVEDKSGQAVRVLHGKLGSEVSLKALTNALGSMESHGLVEREIRGKRTYGIRLAMPEAGMRGESEPNGSTVPPGPQGQVLPDDPEPHITGPGADGMSADGEVDYRLLADALLTRVAEVIDTQTSTADLQTRLATLLADREKFRRQVSQLGEDLTAIKHERDGLRKRLQQAETNIQAMLDPRNKVGLGDRHRRALERFMQATPSRR